MQAVELPLLAVCLMFLKQPDFSEAPVVSATDPVGSGLGETLMLPAASRVTVINLLAINFEKANLPSGFKELGALAVSCSEASLETPPLSFVACF